MSEEKNLVNLEAFIRDTAKEDFNKRINEEIKELKKLGSASILYGVLNGIFVKRKDGKASYSILTALEYCFNDTNMEARFHFEKLFAISEYKEIVVNKLKEKMCQQIVDKYYKEETNGS